VKLQEDGPTVESLVGLKFWKNEAIMRLLVGPFALCALLDTMTFWTRS
jgi:hypothetical protein